MLIALLTYYLRVVRGLVWADWTGIEEKTLWDLLELLIVPAFLGLGAILFNKLLRDNEQRRTAEQQREEAIQHYLDKMSELLIEKELLEKVEDEDKSIMVVARGRTVSTLRMLDRDRQNILLGFVRQANLANHVVAGANLSGVDLSRTYLWKINLTGSDLSRSILTQAFLQGSYLINAYLVRANLRETNLRGADLRNAILRETDLRGADLREADLREADLREADLREASYNDSTKWPKGFDPEKEGAIYKKAA